MAVHVGVWVGGGAGGRAGGEEAQQQYAGVEPSQM